MKRRRRPIRFERLILLAAVVGVVGGLVAAVYYHVLQALLALLWEQGSHEGRAIASFGLPVIAVTAAMGTLVGVATHWLGRPGEIAAVVNNIHLRHGRLDVRKTPAMTLLSLLSIAGGGSAGPEAPLVQIIGSLSSRLGDRLRLYGGYVRTLTFCGMAAALGAFFGAPLGGALFALEIPHRRGLEYYEALVPALVSAGLAFVVFRALTGPIGPLVPVPLATDTGLRAVLLGTAVGVVGAIAGVAFIAVFRSLGALMKPLEQRPVLAGLLGGIGIGLLAIALPAAPFTTLFWSEYQIGDMLHSLDAMTAARGAISTAAVLIAAAGLKTLAVGLTLHSGFRGGFIFPLFFIGAALGAALSLLVGPALPLPIAVLSAMAAVNVAVTKTPVSTTVILTTLSGTSLLPVVGGASMASFLLTTRVNLIPSQQSRR